MHKNVLTVKALTVTLTHALHLAKKQYKSYLDLSQQMASPSHQSQNRTQFPFLPSKSLEKQIEKIHKHIYIIHVIMSMHMYIDAHMYINI